VPEIIGYNTVVDIMGRVLATPIYNTKGMTSPVLCNHCGQVYDLCAGSVIARHADATVYKTPCCDKQVDDRMWVSLPAFRRL
jgi:hypothetical protein